MVSVIGLLRRHTSQMEFVWFVETMELGQLDLMFFPNFSSQHEVQLCFLCPKRFLVCSSRAESRCSQRQQKALSSAVHRLSEALKELQQENSMLRLELSTDSPAGGLKGANTL